MDAFLFLIDHLTAQQQCLHNKVIIIHSLFGNSKRSDCSDLWFDKKYFKDFLKQVSFIPPPVPRGRLFFQYDDLRNNN